MKTDFKNTKEIKPINIFPDHVIDDISTKVNRVVKFAAVFHLVSSMKSQIDHSLRFHVIDQILEE